MCLTVCAYMHVLWTQVVAVFEGLHEGRMLCAAVANDNTLLTGGESTVRPLPQIIIIQQLLYTYFHNLINVFAVDQRVCSCFEV